MTVKVTATMKLDDFFADEATLKELSDEEILEILDECLEYYYEDADIVVVREDTT